MGRSFRSVTPATQLPEFDGKTFRHEASDQYFTPGRTGGKYSLRRHQTGANRAIENILDSPVDYVFGSGNHARSYLTRTHSGSLIELPATWYSEKGGYWRMSPGFDRPDHAGFSRKITYRCLFCHTGYPDLPAGADFWDGGTLFLAQIPEGIDCQRCHGPGAGHVKAAQQSASADAVRNSIVNPSRLAPERQTEICMQCHLETTSGQLPPALLRAGRGVFSYRPGEPLENYVLHFDHAAGTGHEDKFEIVSSVYRLRKSRCFMASAGSLTCTTCHDPHRTSNGDAAAGKYTAACLQCHGGAMAKLVESGRHPAEKECTGCHMPQQRPSDVIHTVMTDHFIRVPRGTPKAPAQEEHDGNTLPYAGEVALYYPSSLPETPDNQIDLAIAQVTQQSNLATGPGRLARAIEQYRPARSEPYFELADAYWQAGRSAEALPLYEQAVKREPKRWHHYLALGVALASAGQASRALEAMERALSLAPWESTILFAMGEISLGQGRLREAEATFRKAIAMNAEMAEGPNNLGTTLVRLGDLAGAEAALREAVRLRPESGAIHVNLAGLLSQRGKLREAMEHFERAGRIGPSSTQARAAFSQAFAKTRSTAKARERFEEALNLQRSDLHNNLGTAFAALGDAAQALQHYRNAVAAAPDSYLANFNLGLTLAEQSKAAEARPYLQKAARSPDAAIRNAALDLLK